MNSSLTTQDIAYIVINPYASYVALGFVLIAISMIVTLGSVISTKSKNSDLILFKENSTTNLELFNLKQATNKAAINNIHSAVSAGLMAPPANYVESTKQQNGTPTHS